MCTTNDNTQFPICAACGSRTANVAADCRNCAARDAYDDNDYHEEPEIIGYECLGCGSTQDHPGECDTCTGYSVEPMYF